MKVKEFYAEIEKLQSQTTWDLGEWSICIIAHTPDDKYVTAFSIDKINTDGEGGIYLESSPKVYLKESLDGRKEN